MGSLSAMNSISRVLEKHGEELKKELMEMIPEHIREHVTGVDLSNEIYEITAGWTTNNGSTLPGPRIGIDTLANRFPDCDVGY